MAHLSPPDGTELEPERLLFPALSQADVRRRSEAERRLPTWLSAPVQFSAVNLVELSQDIDDFSHSIHQDLINHIKVNLSIGKLFPVQKCLIPALAKQFKSRLFRRPNDICVSSPTGSGKTLAYVIPIVNHLKQSVARELRAIVVLPTHDLAQQVYKSFLQVAQSTHLRCALSSGEKQDRSLFKRVPSYHATSSENKFRLPESPLIMASHLEGLSKNDYVSTIDVLVSTPGILIDMIQNVPGFTLRDLQILVIDEADRLMVNHKHDWLNAIDRAVCPHSFECPCGDLNHLKENVSSEDTGYKSNYFVANGCTISHSARSKFIHKLLFSATLSSDPQILMHMNLFQPRLFLATKPSLTGTKIRNSLGSHTSTPAGSPLPLPRNQVPTTVSTRSELLTTTAIPDQLEEKMFITETKDKLYVMWYLMHELKYKNVLCFTNERKKGSELCAFLNEITGVRAANFSSDIKNEVRKKCLSEFKKGTLEVIVATDLLGRGMDIEGVEYVISYDMPLSGTWYAHRVGRTARAGKKGTAITLVDSRQLVQFKKVVQLAHKLPNSMKLSHVVEEMKVPHFGPKDDKKELYIKTFENYQDKLKHMREKNAQYRNK